MISTLSNELTRLTQIAEPHSEAEESRLAGSGGPPRQIVAIWRPGRWILRANGLHPNPLVYFPRPDARSLRIAEFGIHAQPAVRSGHKMRTVSLSKQYTIIVYKFIYFLAILIKKIVFLHQFLTRDHKSVLGTTRKHRRVWCSP